MAEAVPHSDDQALQHFLTNSGWNDQLVIDQIAQDGDQPIGSKKDSCLIIDESGIPKKGHIHLNHGNIKDVYLYPLRKGFRKKLTG